MKQQDFEERYSGVWLSFDSAVGDFPDQSSSRSKEFPELYRQICSHLAMARQRHYSQSLISSLNARVMSGHHLLYQRDNRLRMDRFLDLLTVFPVTLRANYSYLLWAFLLFIIPGIIMGVGCYLEDSLIYSLVSPEQVREFEAMYDPAQRKLGRERGSDSDLLMFGYYIKHNISIAFRTFSGGILFGVGTVFFLFYNGLFLGAIAGRLTLVGFASSFYPFVIGHGAFELTAIVFSGAAGLKIGFSLIAPGSCSRLHALKGASRGAIVILYGAAVMLLLAAFLEAFWSSSTTMPAGLKLVVGGLLWLFVIWYCFISKFNHSLVRQIRE
ncbi:MAG: stage II sporulation protein M [Porticoccaceae bacterium]|nr:stage II sporulation protein M [Pseudomonadales bacterium]MCP5173439.1 stage II sporulation protein M [Pseudomonadales bacterium]MCP5303252.1 stage II sporulation protein M [Pseudomonadales bacterium]